MDGIAIMVMMMGYPHNKIVINAIMSNGVLNIYLRH